MGYVLQRGLGPHRFHDRINETSSHKRGHRGQRGPGKVQEAVEEGGDRRAAKSDSEAIQHRGASRGQVDGGSFHDSVIYPFAIPGIDTESSVTQAFIEAKGGALILGVHAQFHLGGALSFEQLQTIRD